MKNAPFSTAKTPDFNQVFIDCEPHDYRRVGRHITIGGRKAAIAPGYSESLLQIAASSDSFSVARDSDLQMLRTIGAEYEELGEGKYRLLELVTFGNYYRYRLNREGIR